MALAELPVWTIKPDWSGGVLERLEWLTTVLTSRTGSEQRLGFRLAPRRSFDLSFVLAGAERALFDLSVGRVGPGEWWVPLWHAGSTLGAALAAGQTYCPTATPGREWVAPGAALLLGKTAFSYEIAEVTAVGAGGISFAAGVSQTWGPDTKLYPLRRGRLSEQPKATRKTESVALAQARFLLTEPDDYTPIAWPVTYRGTPVLTARPDETQSLSVQYERLVAELDSTTGPSHVVDLAPDLGRTVQQHAWFMAGIAEHSDFRALLHALQGRLVPVWMPTHSADLELVTIAVPGASAIVVKECGYTAFDSIRPGRRDIRIERYDGTADHRRVISSTRVAGGKESLVLDTPLVSGVAPVDVRRISFMSLARLDQDAVEIAHKTDVAGVATVVSGFRSTPENRVATPFVPIRSPFSARTPWLCGQRADCETEGLLAKASFTAQGVSFIDGMGYINSHRVAVAPGGWTPGVIAAFRAAPQQRFSGLDSESFYVTGPAREIMIAADGEPGRDDGGTWCGLTVLGICEQHATHYRPDFVVIGWMSKLTILMHSDLPIVDTFRSVEIRAADDAAVLATSSGVVSAFPVSGGAEGYIGLYEQPLGLIQQSFFDGTAVRNVDPFAAGWAVQTNLQILRVT